MTRSNYNEKEYRDRLLRICGEISSAEQMIDKILSELKLSLYTNISEDEVFKTLINLATQNIKEDTGYDKIATKLLLHSAYQKILGRFPTAIDYQKGFTKYIKEGIKQNLLNPKLTEIYNLEKLSKKIKPERDNLFKYLGLSTLFQRYAVLGRDHKPLEVPQYTWMRIAMGFAMKEKESDKWAIKFYDKMSKLEYISGGSSLIGSGTTVPRLSNCFILEIHDSIDHIAKTLSDVMKLTKATGGIGLSVTKLRSEGSPVRSNNTHSSGPIPFLHTIDSTLRAVSRAGKKMGALVFYMENWHIDFDQFLDLKQNTGDEYRRTKTANTAVYISDEFMNRVKNDDHWYLFDPLEVADLNEAYGKEFSEKYNKYVKKAEKGKLRVHKKIRAREQFKSILISLQTTSHPWLTWKDPINVRALNNNTGTIHSSNLCTEICLPQDDKSIAVCNLTSINLSRHIDRKKQILDWDKFEESIRFAIRQLDDLIDNNVLPLPEAEQGDKQNRAIGLGVMGFTDSLEQLGYPYDSEEAYAFADQVFEFLSYVAIDESANLAKERGSYPNFEGSRWSKGIVPYDTLNILEEDRKAQITIQKGMTLDWHKLRRKVKRGMRNATLMAVAPTANIGHVAGTSPSIDPRFAQVFSRANNTGKYLDINENLVQDLKKHGIWQNVKNEIVENYGDLTNIDEIPDHLKKIYKTSFQISPYAFIEVAARAQKWIDQALSRNMYLETRDVNEMMSIYINAWEKGLKTTYYLHVKPRHQAEQSTVKVNKSVGIGKKGFGALRTINKAVSMATSSVAKGIADACPTDPQERLNCDSCQ